MNYQRQVYENVANRGYMDAWQVGQLIWRQICKLSEELAELAFYAPVQHRWRELQMQTGHCAGVSFDFTNMWYNKDGPLPYPDEDVREKMLGELADIQVVVFCLAELLGVEDIGRLAAEKSAADIARGVRKNDT